MSILNEIFATIYETWFGLYNADYDLIFATLYDEGGYQKLGLSFVLIPLTCWLLFYYVWKYPYAQLWHWLVWLLITAVIVAGISYGIANTEIFASNNQALNDALADESTNYKNYAETLPLTYSIYNGLFAIVLGFLYSLVMKQFSKIHTHLPF